MSGVYTVRFGALQGSAGQVWDLLVPVVGSTWIVRDILVTNTGENAAGVSVWFEGSGNAYRVHLLSLQGLAAGTSHHLELRQELLVGETLRATSDAVAWDAVVTGYRFAGGTARVGVLPAHRTEP